MKKAAYVLLCVLPLATILACEPDTGSTQNPEPAEVVENEEEVTETEPEETAKPQLDAAPESKPDEGAAAYLHPEQAGIVADDLLIYIDQDFKPQINVLGEPETEEGQACLEEGFDTNYYYGDEELVVYTKAEGGSQIIYGIYATKKGYKTSDDIEIGVSTKDDIFGKYGDADESFGPTWIYYVGSDETKLSFVFDKKDVLKSIDVNTAN